MQVFIFFASFAPPSRFTLQTIPFSPFSSFFKIHDFSASSAPPLIESSDSGEVVVTATDMVVECGTTISLKQLSADVADTPRMVNELSSKVRGGTSNQSSRCCDRMYGTHTHTKVISLSRPPNCVLSTHIIEILTNLIPITLVILLI